MEKTKHKNGTVVLRDDLYKIHKFRNFPLVIYNHGVNKFGEKSWKTLCSDYEASNRWDYKNLEQISEDFRGFVNMDVGSQLISNLNNFHKDEDLRMSFFNLSCKNTQKNRYEMLELCWSIDSGGVHFKSDLHRGFIRSGDGKKYLEEYIKSKNEIGSLNYWEGMNIRQAKDILTRSFFIAVNEKNLSGGNEFSDNFDIECILG
ncbi:MAG: hypothetical protein ABII16_01390 [Patescibacteria group bacterium]|nr:hypothetical protein [Patescibacteria group bacterium]